VIVVGLASIWFVSRELRVHNLTIRTDFRNTESLKPGATVRVDGVDLGTVKAVNLRPEFGKRPVEVVMELRADHGLQIPSNSIASPEADGVLGPTFVEIDTHQAAGPPLRNNEILQSLEPDVMTNEQAARAMEKLGTVLIEESQKLRQKGTSSPK
jgi:phospholipid/cholesterol/gamma-HCH transport system substrate-binding protein